MSDIDTLKPSIGTRVFVVIPPKGVVVPATVIEKVIRETPQGVSSQYLLNFGEPGKTRIPSDAIPGSIVVDSPKSAYDAIVRHAEKKAKQAVQLAVQIAEQRFGPSNPQPPQPPQPPQLPQLPQPPPPPQAQQLPPLAIPTQAAQPPQEDMSFDPEQLMMMAAARAREIHDAAEAAPTASQVVEAEEIDVDWNERNRNSDGTFAQTPLQAIPLPPETAPGPTK